MLRVPLGEDYPNKLILNAMEAKIMVKPLLKKGKKTYIFSTSSSIESDKDHKACNAHRF